MITRYGIISDAHENSRIVGPALEVLKKEGIDKLIVNGDIGNTPEFIADVIITIGESGIEAYIMPGSHEPLELYAPIITSYTYMFSNLRNMLMEKKVEEEDHHLVFIPGSDYAIGGGVTFGLAEDTPTGVYMQQRGRDLYYKNLNDLKTTVTDSEKTILISHVPRKFDNLNTCVDMAYYHETEEGGVIPGIQIEREIRKKHGNVDYNTIKLLAAKEGYNLKKENRGNKELREIMDELKITKAVSGHFHESGHRANDKQGNHVSENHTVDELFWNAGHLDAGQAGILTVEDGKVSYRNINMGSDTNKPEPPKPIIQRINDKPIITDISPSDLDLYSR